LHRQYAWFNAVGVVAGQVLGVLALIAGGDVFAYTFIVGGATVATTAVGWKLSGLCPTLPTFNRALLLESRDFIWGGFAFLTWNLTIAVTGGIDRVLLGLLVPAAEVGWYAAAYRIFSIPVFIPNLIMTPLFPALSRSVNSPETIRRTVTKTLRVVMLLMVPMTAGIVVVAPALPSLFGWPADEAANAAAIADLRRIKALKNAANTAAITADRKARMDKRVAANLANDAARIKQTRVVTATMRPAAGARG
jgi:O-antigen/teichoic acid export membrane protein